MSDYTAKPGRSIPQPNLQTEQVALTPVEVKMIEFIRQNEINLDELWDLAPHAPNPAGPEADTEDRIEP